jgi:hypothetical protein
MILISLCAAAPWLYPSSAPLSLDPSLLGEVGGGSVLFIRSPSYHPNPNSYTGPDFDPGFFARAAIQPKVWLVAEGTLGIGTDGVVQPIFSVRANLIQNENFRLGAFIGSTVQGSLSPNFRSFIWTHGLSIETGGQHLRFDAAIPLLGGEIIKPNSGATPLTDFGEADIPFTPLVFFYQEFGISGVFDKHSARLGLVYTLLTLSYRYDSARWFAGVGSGLDLFIIANNFCFDCGYLPVISKLEAGYRF